MSHDIVIVLDKIISMIIDERNIAYLDLIAHSQCDHRSYLNREAYTARCEQQVYNRVLDIYGIDKTKNLRQLKEWRLKTINSDVASKRVLVKLSQLDLLLRQRKYSFLIQDSYIREIRKQVKKSADKLTSITKFLKIFGLLQYCKREDLQDELKSCFVFFIHQLKRLQHRKQIETISKVIVEILKVFCVTDFMKISVLCSSKEDFIFLLKCLKRQKYNFCGIFNETEKYSYPIAWTLINNCLTQLKYLLILGTTNLHLPKVHWTFFERFYLRFSEYCKYFEGTGSWIFCLRRYKKRNYLVMQIIYLYLIQQSFLSSLPTQVMVLLWKNIPDIFLTKNELLRPYDYHLSWEAELLHSCWLWYHRNVIDQEVSIQSSEQLTKRTLFVGEYSPRCLKHLARCAVRRNMAASYLEPPYYNLVGEIPQELQKYLEIEFVSNAN